MSLRTLIPLGTNGFFPSHGRATMCFLLLGDGAPLLLDAGTGVARLAEPGVRARLDPSGPLDIVLSHYHLDHVVGLAYLGAVWRGPVTLWAPAPPLVDAEPADALDRLLAPPLFPKPLSDFPHPVTLRAYRRDFRLGDRAPVAVRCRRQRHPGGSVALRLDDLLVYATDTAAEAETSDFAAGARCLLHELWVTESEAERDPDALRGHTSLRQALVIARRSGVALFVPVHHHPARDVRQLAALRLEVERALAAERGAPAPVWPEEGEAVDLESPHGT